MSRGQVTCFFEEDPTIALVRRAVVECVGTLLLVIAAAGSGVLAQQALHDGVGLGRLAGATATAGALVGLIVALGSVSGGHFNPLITILQWLAGERPLGCSAAYVAAQCGGSVVGTVLTNLTFGAGLTRGTAPTAPWPLVWSELIAATGLMVVVFGCARSGRTESGPFAAGAWLVAAILATPSASYGNPALTLGAVFAAGPIALSPTTAALYGCAEIVGALLALPIIAIAYPRRRREGRRMAALAAPSAGA